MNPIFILGLEAQCSTMPLKWTAVLCKNSSTSGEVPRLSFQLQSSCWKNTVQLNSSSSVLAWPEHEWGVGAVVVEEDVEEEAAGGQGVDRVRADLRSQRVQDRRQDEQQTHQQHHLHTHTSTIFTTYRHTISLTSTVLLSPNEDSDFFSQSIKY